MGPRCDVERGKGKTERHGRETGNNSKREGKWRMERARESELDRLTLT